MEVGIQVHRGRDSVNWVLAKLTEGEKSPELDEDNPMLDGVLHHLGARLKL